MQYVPACSGPRRPGALAALGQPDKADQVMVEAARHTGQYMAIYHPQMILANAWVAAARGGYKTAITLARKAAEQGGYRQ